MISREELRDSARKGLGSDGLMPDATQSWDRLVEMGWFVMALPEEDGGLGLGAEALASVHVELGRALMPGAAIAQMAAIEVLAAAPDFAGRADLLASAAGGERIAFSLEAQGAGSLAWVPDADLAGQMLVVSADRIALAPIVSATHRATWDMSRRLFDVAVGDETVIATGADAARLHERAQATVLLALAADSVGAAEAALEMSVEYLKTRRQFDRPLALFQALKHRVADMRIAVSAAEALLWSRTGDGVSLADLGSLKAYACAAFLHVAEETVQLHGGIGLTVEHPCHLFLKRAFLNAALCGDADHWNAQAGRKSLLATT
ncbi:MAG: acyl-CoA/acyl-ACP dehydrogenase [Novosphingobium sp.]|nr:acyl-CoA/acyl-ACP dehydrogenase [Novosphingobium sp.]